MLSPHRFRPNWKGGFLRRSGFAIGRPSTGVHGLNPPSGEGLLIREWLQQLHLFRAGPEMDRLGPKNLVIYSEIYG